MPYGFFRPTRGVRACMDAWLRAGGPHHQVLNRGRVRAALGALLRGRGHRARAGLIALLVEPPQ